MEERLKELRKSLGMTQQAFADKLNVTRDTIANYESGRREPTKPVVSLICSTFNINETWLRTGEGEMVKKMSRDAEVTRFVAEALSGGNVSDEIKARFLAVLPRMSPAFWSALDEFGKELAKEYAEK